MSERSNNLFQRILSSVTGGQVSRRPAVALRDPAPPPRPSDDPDVGHPPLDPLHELELDDPRWRSFVAASPEATSFHNPAWAQLLADCYGYRPFALAALDGSGELQAGLPFL